MKQRILYFLFALVAAAAPTLFAADQVERIDVKAMKLAPGASFDPSAVISRMKTTRGAVFSQTDFDEDLKTLSEEFDRIEPAIDTQGDKVFIEIKVWTKPTIRAIRWQGNEKFMTSRLSKELGVKEGTVFDRRAFNQSFHKVKGYYVKKGYFEAELKFHVNLDQTTNEVDIDIEIKEGRAGRIAKIAFSGVNKTEEEAILGLMVTKKYNRFTSWVTGEGLHNRDKIQHDQMVILNYLQNQGYADAKVDVKVTQAKDKKRINILIKAEKGLSYKIGKVSVSGNKLFDNKTVWSHLKLRKGQKYSPDRVREARRDLARFYGKRGYIDAVVNYELKLSADDPEYTVHFTIEEGKRYRVGLIKVIGNTQTHSSVILHESLLVPGDIFDLDRLAQTEERLRMVRFFSNVNVYAVKVDRGEEKGAYFRDVHIEVEETSTGNFVAFFGISSAEKAFGGGKITENNFNYAGLTRLFKDGYGAMRGGGEYAFISGTIGKRHNSYVLSWTKPYFFDSKWSFGFDMEKASNRIYSRGYDINTLGLSVHAKHPINQFVRFGCHYRIKDSSVDLRETKADTPEEEAQLKPEDLATHEARKEAMNSGLVSAVGVSLEYDSTDHPIRPRRGFRSTLSGEFAGVWGDFVFSTLSYHNTFYFPMTPKGVMKYRWDFRFLQPFGHTSRFELPLDERFFLGGENTVRGFRSFALGPKFPNGDPRGGISEAILSVEYDHQIFSKLSGFLFFDAGNLTLETWKFDKLFTSIGYGVRITLFENGPPFTVGFGFPLNEDTEGDIRRFFFSLGGKF